MEKIGYKVKLYSQCESDYSEEEYGDWSESCSNSFDYISRTKEKDYPDVVSSLDITIGDPCYVVWVEWSSGDSFGSGYRNNSDAVAVFKTYEDADDLKNRIERRSENDPYMIKYTAKDGQEIDIYAGGWTGYFETLESVNIEHVIMQK